MDTISGAVYGPPPPALEIAFPTYAKDHHSTSHRQGMEAANIVVDKYEAQTHENKLRKLYKPLHAM